MTDHPAEGMQGARELAMIAADCHRSKWEFDVSDENPPTAAEARKLVRLAFDELHRIGNKALDASVALSQGGSGEPVAWRQSDEAVRNLIAREIWRYQECEEAYGPFDDNANESKQLDVGMRSLIKQTAIDQAELIRAVVLASPVVKAAIARLITDDDIYDIGKRDGYEDAVQDFDIATGGDGEFRGSTIPGRAVDVPAMKARVIARLNFPAANAAWHPVEDYVPGHDNLNVLAAHDGFVSEAYYNGEDDTWYKAGKSPHDFDFVDSDLIYPTHWMPLPAPPTSLSREEGSKA